MSEPVGLAASVWGLFNVATTVRRVPTPDSAAPRENPTIAVPLSVEASVAGLITAAAAIYKVLAPYASAARLNPHIVLQVWAEIQEASISLASLQGLASNLAALPAQRAALIHVDNLVAILTNGVLVFSDLETCVSDMPRPCPSSKPPLQHLLQWQRKESDLKPILARLRDFKASVSMLLGVFQSKALVRAEQWQTELSSTVADLLRNHRDMSRRLMRLEASFDDARSCVTIGPYAGRNPEIHDNNFMAPSFASPDERRDGASDASSLGDSESHWMPSFQDDLDLSMPYRRAKRDIIDASPRNSVAFSDACWSMISGISLGNISSLAVVCLPVHAGEISNCNHYRFAGEIDAVLDINILEHGFPNDTTELEELTRIRSQFRRWPETNPLWTCLQQQDGPGSLLYYDLAISFPSDRSDATALRGRLYICTANIVVVRDGIGNHGTFKPAVLRIPFRHVVFIAPIVPAHVNRRFSFLPPAPDPRPDDLSLDTCEIYCTPCPTSANDGGTPRPNVKVQIAFANTLRMRQALGVVAQRHREIGTTALHV